MKPIASLDEVPVGQPTLVSSGSKEFLVYRQGRDVTVCGNLCPHHGARLNHGTIHDGILTCPRHHARFDIKTGTPISPPSLDGITVYESELVGEEIHVGRPRSAMPQPVTPEEHPHVVVIGGGAAGIGCAESLRRLKFPGRITIVSDEPDLPYDRTTLTTNFFLGPPGETAPLREAGYFQLLGMELLAGKRATRVDRDAHAVHFDDGGTSTYDKLLIATGVGARKLGVRGANLEGVYTLRSAADGSRIRGRAEETNRVVIIGAGFLGLEMAFTFATLGKQVYVAAPEKNPLEVPLGSAYSARITALLADSGITWLPGRMVREFAGDESLRELILDDGNAINSTLAVVAVGTTARELPAGIEELADESGVRVDRQLRTSDPDIFAAGDIVAGNHPTGHWVTAMRQGWYAAGAIIGHTEPHLEIPFFWSDLGPETIRSVGHRSGTEPIVQHGDIQSGDFLAIWQANGRTTGAFAVGYAPELISIENALRAELSG